MFTKEKHFSLSVDEIGLSFSLISQSDVGRSILMNTYGDISRESIEDKLISASHSLLARGAVKISSTGAVVLDESIELALFPLVKYKNLIQVLLTGSNDKVPEIVNVYIGENGTFTSVRINMGVVYELFHSRVDDIPGLIYKLLDLPVPDKKIKDIGDQPVHVKMSGLVELMSGPQADMNINLRKLGVVDDWAIEFQSDLKTPKKRGSVVITNVTSDNAEQNNNAETGAGFLYLSGRYQTWVFVFEKADEQSQAQLMIGTELSIKNTLSQMVNRL